MIDIRTVLVLGAGASYPYDFPLGYELRDLAVNRNMSAIHDVLKQVDSTAAGQLDVFRKELRESKCGSIDAFLEGRPEFETVGKAVIAYYLIDRESPSPLLNANRSEDWYAYLIDLMLSDDVRKFGQNKLSVITYNYDRSLEQYILTVLQARYKLTRDECLDAISKMQIVHVHGKLGELPSADGATGCAYEKNITSERLKSAIDGIRIVHDGTLENDPRFTLARKLLASAQNVIFLGFGYLKENIDRLKLDENKKDGTNYFGTAVGLTLSELEFIGDLFPYRIGYGSNKSNMVFDVESVSVRDFICNNLHLFRRRYGEMADTQTRNRL